MDECTVLELGHMPTHMLDEELTQRYGMEKGDIALAKHKGLTGGRCAVVTMFNSNGSGNQKGAEFRVVDIEESSKGKEALLGGASHETYVVTLDIYNGLLNKEFFKGYKPGSNYAIKMRGKEVLIVNYSDSERLYKILEDIFNCEEYGLVQVDGTTVAYGKRVNKAYRPKTYEAVG